jgi:hypothetical protein
VTMKNVVFWEVILCDSCKNWRFRGRYRLHHQSVEEAIHSTGMLVPTRATQHNILEDGILHGLSSMTLFTVLKNQEKAWYVW